MKTISDLKIGGKYMIATFRSDFGPYWITVEIIEIKEMKHGSKALTLYSIKMKKLSDPYSDEYNWDYSKPVWCHKQGNTDVKYRYLEVVYDAKYKDGGNLRAIRL